MMMWQLRENLAQPWWREHSLLFRLPANKKSWISSSAKADFPLTGWHMLEDSKELLSFPAGIFQLNCGNHSDKFTWCICELTIPQIWLAQCSWARHCGQGCNSAHLYLDWCLIFSERPLLSCTQKQTLLHVWPPLLFYHKVYFSITKSSSFFTLTL